MKVLFRSVFGFGVGVALMSCATGGNDPQRDREPALASEGSAITQGCSEKTLGLPCDPDGQSGPLLECQGVCAIATNGNVGCLTLNRAGLTNLNGRICGTSNGVGDEACAHYCFGKGCLAANAPLGTACRPTANSNACEGQCNGRGACTALDAPCEFGRDGQSCTFSACNFNNASECKSQNLPAKTACSPFDACTSGVCDEQGACTAGATRSCDDGNTCTDDSCDPASGACLNTPNDGNTCSDGSVCTVGDHCSNGRCVNDSRVDCNDNNACTVDSCNGATGCLHTPKTCDDGNACTVDSCNPVNGVCRHTTLDCDDHDACTTDSCDRALGCKNVARDCDDHDGCTTDTCSAGSCVHGDVVCDDHDACTTDACVTGRCAFEPIANCGGGNGTGGAATGGSANGGEPNDGGAGGTTGGSDVGTGGTTGGSDVGTGGTTGGSDLGTGGTTGGSDVGSGGTTGGSDVGSGGTTGGSDVGSGGTTGGSDVGTGGTTGSGGGSNSSGGAASGGSDARGGAGASSQAGNSGSAQAGNATAGLGPVLDGSEDSSCSCSVPGNSRTSTTSPWLLTLTALAFGRRRRRGKRR